VSWTHHVARIFRRVGGFLNRWPDLDRAEREAQPPTPPPATKAVEPNRERELDEGLEDTFPASDPPARHT